MCDTANTVVGWNNNFEWENTLESTLEFEELKDPVILDKASNMAGEPAPWAESDPTSSWSNRATIRTPDSWSSECSAEDESIRAWNSIGEIIAWCCITKVSNNW